MLKLGSLEKSQARDRAWAHQNGTLEPSRVLEWLDSARARESENNFWADFRARARARAQLTSHTSLKFQARPELARLREKKKKNKNKNPKRAKTHSYKISEKNHHKTVTYKLY
jgi:hypothetical protein